MSTIIVVINGENNRFWRVIRQSSDIALPDYITSIDVDRRYFTDTNINDLLFVRLLPVNTEGFLTVEICDSNGRKSTMQMIIDGQSDEKLLGMELNGMKHDGMKRNDVKHAGVKYDSIEPNGMEHMMNRRGGSPA